MKCDKFLVSPVRCCNRGELAALSAVWYVDLLVVASALAEEGEYGSRNS